MNSTLKISLAALSFALGVTAQAQLFAPDASLTNKFATDSGLAAVATSATAINASAKGVGWDGGNFASQFGGAPDVAHARSHWNQGIYEGTTIAAGSFFQFGVHAYALNRSNAATPVSIFVSMYKYQAGAGGVIPKGNAIFTNLEVVLQSNSAPVDKLHYSSKIILGSGLSQGDQYILCFAGSSVAGAAAPANFATVMTRNVNLIAEVPTADKPFFRNDYQTFNNSANNGGTADLSSTTSQPVAYRFYAGAVPEPTSVLALTLGVALMARRRKGNA